MIDGTIDHIGVIVEDVDEAAARYARLTGVAAGTPTEVEALGLRLCFVGGFELMESTNPDTSIGQFLERRGAGLHHVAFRVPDIAESMRTLKADGVAFFDKEPRRSVDGRLIAFLHPSSTGESLVELVQDVPPDAAPPTTREG